MLVRVKERLGQRGISFSDAWYMDDGQIVCNPMHADDVIRALDEEAQTVGASRGWGAEAKSVCRLFGTIEQKMSVPEGWRSEYMQLSSKSQNGPEVD